MTGAVKSVTIDGETAEYTYDGMGNILTETEGDVVKSYTYDERGRKSGYTISMDGQVISTATYTYDTSDRLKTVTEGGKTTTYTYDANGNRASQTVDNVTTTYSYNNANLVTTMTNKMGDVVISSYAYTYYADGNMHTKAETLLDVTTNTTYVYDGVGRLTSETIGDKVISYYYDANGNRTLMNNDGVITSYTYDKNNRLLTEGDIVYTYDANGNTLTAGDKTYTYNARGQQVGYTDGTVTATYAYNPSGLRSAKTVSGSTKYFVYNGMQIVFEYEDSVSDGTTYYYGLNRTHSSDGDIFVYNAHGDTVQLVNGGSLSASYTYDAFGNLTNTVGTSDNPFLYCSEYFDSETQTYYLRARYYNPANGRFTQEDPIGAGLNWYTYCSSNPVMYVDPWGLVEVGMRAYAATYEGSVVEWDAETGTASVTWNGTTLSVQSTPVNNREGRIYVDDLLFIEAFGIGDKTTVVFVEGNNVSIRANFDITNNASPYVDGNQSYDYAELFLRGIRYTWNGAFGQYSVSTYVGTSSNGVSVTINGRYGVPNVRGGWSPDDLGVMTMYTGDSRTDVFYDFNRFYWVCGHEFGHILGVGDVYNDPSSKHLESVFNKFGTPVSELDVTAVIRANSLGIYQKWREGMPVCKN